MENQPPEKTPAEIIENAAPETPIETALETGNPEIAPEITTETNLNSNLKNENKNESENDTENTAQETVGNAPENALGDAPRTPEENPGCESGKPAQTSPLDNSASAPPATAAKSSPTKVPLRPFELLRYENTRHSDLAVRPADTPDPTSRVLTRKPRSIWNIR